MDVFGDTKDIFTGPWCWIKTNRKVSNMSAIFWMLITVKGWELLSYLCLAEVLVVVIYRMYILPRLLRQTPQFRQFGQEGIQGPNRLRKEDRNFVFVWLIFYGLRFGGTFRFLIHVAKDPLNDAVLSHTEEIMMIWQAFGDTAQAFLNFLVLCVCDRTIRNHYLCSCASDQDNNTFIEDSTDTTGL